MIEEGYRVADQKDESFTLDNLTSYLNYKVLLSILFIVTLVLYLPSFFAPFYLDDYPSIVENRAIHDISQIGNIWNFYFPRFIGYLSFSFNYTLGGESTFGYHVVNFLIHCLAGLGVFLLTRTLLLATNKEPSSHEKNLYLYTIPFLAALIFLINPQQTQSVTYIVQRLSSMAAMFYIFALWSYAHARLNQQHAFFLLTAIFAGLAFFTKQNTATLPAAILLIELVFFQQLNKAQWKKLVLISLPVLAVFIFIVVQYFDLSLEKLDSLTSSLHAKTLSRGEYFSTQMLVVWHYIVQFFIPTNLHLDYDFPIEKSFFSAKVLIAFLAHLTLLVGAFLLRKHSPIITFAIFFYYLAHLVESSVVPIADVVFEHRTYLPNLGISLIIAIITYQLWANQNLQKVIIGLLVGLTLWFSWLTFDRNRVWNDQLAFYQNEVKLSPNKERVWADLGKYYLKKRQFDDALKTFGKALNLGREGNTINALPTTLLNTYFALIYTNQLQKALHFEGLIPVDMLNYHELSVFHYMKGNRQAKMGDYVNAKTSHAMAVSINPDYIDAKANLAATHMALKENDQAKVLLEEVLAKDPQHKSATIYYNQLKKLTQQ